MDKTDDIYCDEFKKNCINHVKVLNREYYFNPQMAGIFVSAVCIFGGFTVGRLIDEFGTGWLDEVYAVDIWSIIHLIVCFGLMILFTILLRNKNWAFILAFVVSSIIEPIEYYLQSVYGIESLGYEIIPNKYFDIVFNGIGIILAYFVVDRFLCKTENINQSMKQ